MILLTLNTLVMAFASPLSVLGVAPDTAGIEARAPAPLGNGVPLRIMPLGASITFGLQSSDGNGYREVLRDLIVNGGEISDGEDDDEEEEGDDDDSITISDGDGSDNDGKNDKQGLYIKSIRIDLGIGGGGGGNVVNMVGSRQSGTMRDNDVEGWSGYRVEQVHAKAMAAASAPHYKPNVVLINAGTNDATQDFNVSTTGERMEALIRDLWRVSPRAVVVLSTLLVNGDPESELNVININAQYRALVERLQLEGEVKGEGTEGNRSRRPRHRIVLAEMHDDDDAPRLDDIPDGTHPNDEGYRKMAKIWYAALRTASEKGWLRAPERVRGVPDDGNE
ncbi:carbohydrate esterase [Corynascus novoguineensis]|uniref:Carbohydrate esterase n=1 Tax=Corynascus novoguineensis TaxID=1126955 RepID=A0AAN7CSY6_9PEZI|nr:carbohydrate esterase [Corynascus novoguineensis]